MLNAVLDILAARAVCTSDAFALESSAVFTPPEVTGFVLLAVGVVSKVRVFCLPSRAVCTSDTFALPARADSRPSTSDCEWV